jgi:hypothetical protein
MSSLLFLLYVTIKAIFIKFVRNARFGCDYGMWRRVVWNKFAYVSEERIAYVEFV